MTVLPTAAATADLSSAVETTVLPTAAAPRWPYLLGAITAIVVSVLANSLALGLAAACVAAVSAMCFATIPISRRKVVSAEAMARFIALLANQATVSRTVNEAISRAAPLMDGAVGQAAQTLAQECRTSGVGIAAQNFAQRASSRRTSTPAASWLAEVITTSATGGGKWVSVLAVLESEATEDAVTARHFHRQVGALLTQVAIATLLGAGIVVGSARISADSWQWFVNGDGAAVALAVALTMTLFARKLLAGAWEILR